MLRTIILSTLLISGAVADDRDYRDLTWYRVPATFQDSRGGEYYLSNDRLTYFADVGDGDGCAIIPIVLDRNDIAAWEITLGRDDLYNEGSAFGAVIASTYDSYESYDSSDVYMLRSYSGEIYKRDYNSVADVSTVHEANVVRVEFNGPDGTLTFYVNREKQDYVITGITEPIYPAVVSYDNYVIMVLKEFQRAKYPSDHKAANKPKPKPKPFIEKFPWFRLG